MSKRHLRAHAVGFAIMSGQQVQLMTTLFQAIRKLAENAAQKEIEALAKHGWEAGTGLDNDIDVFGEEAAFGKGSKLEVWATPDNVGKDWRDYMAKRLKAPEGGEHG